MFICRFATHFENIPHFENISQSALIWGQITHFKKYIMNIHQSLFYHKYT